jgi:hypothetical protein
MPFWSELGNKITDTGGITSSLSTLAGAGSFSEVLSGIQGVAGSINDYFNKGKPEEYRGFNVNEFKASFVAGRDGGVARNNLFEVMVTPPVVLNSVANKDLATKLLARRIESIEMPSKNINTMPVPTYGPVRKIASGAMYNEIDLSMILSESMTERKFFVDWMESIQPSLMGIHDGDVAYYDEYRGTVQIRIYDQDGSSPRLNITLVEAYPISIGETTLSWGDNDSYMKSKVKFQYRSFYENYFEKGEAAKDTSIVGMLRSLREDVRSMVTDIRNLRYNFKQIRSNLKDVKNTIQRDFKSGDPLGKLEALAAGPAAIAGALNDSAFKLLDRSSSGSVGSVGESISSNFSKYFSF